MPDHVHPICPSLFRYRYTPGPYDPSNFFFVFTFKTNLFVSSFALVSTNRKTTNLSLFLSLSLWPTYLGQKQSTRIPSLSLPVSCFIMQLQYCLRALPCLLLVRFVLLFPRSILFSFPQFPALFKKSFLFHPSSLDYTQTHTHTHT